MSNQDSLRVVRLLRTASSEIYEVRDIDEVVARIDIHFTDELTYAVIIMSMDCDEVIEQALLTILEEEIAPTYQNTANRSDMIVTVYKGQEVSRYGDTFEEEYDLFDDDYENGESRN